MTFEQLLSALNYPEVAQPDPGASSAAGAKRGARNRLPRAMGIATLAAGLLAPTPARACACGCGIFEVGTSSMFPEGTGGVFYLNYDFQDQLQNWSGDSKAPPADNPDKEIRTHFLSAGLQYMFNRSWGIQAELPYVNRYFKTTGGASGSDIVSLNWGDWGDLRVQGIYTGFSDDLSTGVNFGLKLPTGNLTYNDAYGDVDRDSEVGTGSSDLLLGGYHRQNFNKVQGLGWFAQAELDLPVTFRDQYRPGLETDAALGLYYQGLSLGNMSVSPVAQILGSERTSDSGQNAANPVASGYQRVLLSPGVELHMHPVKVYADVEFPVYQHMTGDQLVAPVLFKLTLSYMF